MLSSRFLITFASLFFITLITTTSAQPSQNQTDYNEWIYLNITGNIAARPYVSDFSIINGNSVVTVISGVTSPTNNDANLRVVGAVVPVVSPINLCLPSTTSLCYNPPNRVGLTIGYLPVADGSLSTDFTNPSVTLSTPVNASTVFDVTINFNRMSPLLGWSWMNGDLLYSEFHANASSNSSWIRLKFRLANKPTVTFPASNGCTATPIRDCNITQASGAPRLSFESVFSMDQTLGGSAALQGAVFATSYAIIGYLLPTSSYLEYQLSSSHFTQDGVTLTLGSLKAFISQPSVLNLFPSLPNNITEIISALNVSRSGATGTESSINITEITVAAQGTQGVSIEVKGITFSTPSYIVRVKSSAGMLHASPVMITLVMLFVMLFLRY